MHKHTQLIVLWQFSGSRLIFLVFSKMAHGGFPSPGRERVRGGESFYPPSSNPLPQGRGESIFYTSHLCPPQVICFLYF